jgi:hypothetical protein
MAYATASPADHHHGRMDQSIVLTFGEHRGWCMYPPVDPYGDGYVAHIRVQLMDDGLRAETTATIDGSPTGGASDLAGFVQNLADDWQGWSDTRVWRALENEMTLEASHDGRAHVMLAVTIRRSR